MSIPANQAAEQRTASTTARRASVPAFEAMLNHATPVLDHGFVRVVDTMRDDAAVVQAARNDSGALSKSPLVRSKMSNRQPTAAAPEGWDHVAVD